MIEYRSASSAVPPMAWADGVGCSRLDVAESARSASRQLVYTPNVVCCETTDSAFLSTALARWLVPCVSAPTLQAFGAPVKVVGRAWAHNEIDVMLMLDPVPH
jgi:hypothetical protein